MSFFLVGYALIVAKRARARTLTTNPSANYPLAVDLN